MAKVSIVVPVYKVERYIRPCIESLQAQTLEDLQIILVDDGSPDTCGSICDEYAARDSRIHVIHKANGGVSAARNDGLAAATGQWVIFCDSDDWMEKDALERLVKVGEQEQADVVFGDIYQVKGEARSLRVFFKNEFATSDRNLIESMIATNFCRAYCFDPPAGGPALGYGGPWNKLVRRELLVDHDIRFDLRVKGIFDDVIYSAHILAAAGRVAYAHIPVYNYRLLTDSITQTYKPQLLQINEAIFTAWEEFMAQYGLQEQMRIPYYANVIRRLENAMCLYYFNKKNPMKLAQKVKELDQLMDTEPYRSAIRDADESKQSSRYLRLVLRCARTGSAWMLWGAYSLNRAKIHWNKLMGK